MSYGLRPVRNLAKGEPKVVLTALKESKEESCDYEIEYEDDEEKIDINGKLYRETQRALVMVEVKEEQDLEEPDGCQKKNKDGEWLPRKPNVSNVSYNNKSSKLLPSRYRSNVRATKSFTWTDDEVELLLRITIEYKNAMAARDIDWESVQAKYMDILERFLDKYPSPEDAKAQGKDFPQRKNEITKAQLAAKLKAIRNKYRHALNSGRKQGHGRVILLFSKLCEDIWGGKRTFSHALPLGIETEDLLPEDRVPCASISGAVTNGVNSDDGRNGGEGRNGHDSGGGGMDVVIDDDEDDNDDGGDDDDDEGSGVDLQEMKNQQAPPTIVTRNYPVKMTLPSQRRDKLKRKLSPSRVAQEDLELKRRIAQRLDAADREFASTMNRLAASAEEMSANFKRLVDHIISRSNNNSNNTNTNRPQELQGPSELQLQEQQQQQQQQQVSSESP